MITIATRPLRLSPDMAMALANAFDNGQQARYWTPMTENRPVEPEAMLSHRLIYRLIARLERRAATYQPWTKSRRAWPAMNVPIDELLAGWLLLRANPPAEPSPFYLAALLPFDEQVRTLDRRICLPAGA